MSVRPNDRWYNDARRLITILGVGIITATALIAAIGKAETFKHGRDLAAWLGLVPRQSTTGGKPRLLGISKRGNKYRRKLLIHGARAALPHVAERDTHLGSWIKDLLARVHPNVAVVALANKLARGSVQILSLAFFKRQQLRFGFPQPETATACSCNALLTTGFPQRAADGLLQG